MLAKMKEDLVMKLEKLEHEKQIKNSLESSSSSDSESSEEWTYDEVTKNKNET